VTTLEPSQVVKRISVPGQGEVVLVNASSAPARNIFLLDSSGRVVWQIEAATLSHGIQGFSDVYFTPDNSLAAYSANGIEYSIHLQTGRISKKELIR
jgi:hypothetical protein